MRSCNAARLSGVPSRALRTSYVSDSARSFASSALVLVREVKSCGGAEVYGAEEEPAPLLLLLLLLPPHSLLL